MVLCPAGLRDDEAIMPKGMSLHKSCRILQVSFLSLHVASFDFTLATKEAAKLSLQKNSDRS